MMNHARMPRLSPDRHGIAIPFVLIVCIILIIMGVSGSFQVSSTRKIFEKMYARRIQLLVAESAFEEISARMENLYPNIPFPGFQDLNTPRNLSTDITSLQSTDGGTLPDWPTELDPERTREVFKPYLEQGSSSPLVDGISPVSIQMGDRWFLKFNSVQLADNPDFCRVDLQEVGIMELAVSVGVRAGSSVQKGEIKVRRYLDARGVANESYAELRVHPRNMVMRF